MRACDCGSLQLVKYLLEKNVQINVVCIAQQRTAFYIACERGHQMIVSMLLDHSSIQTVVNRQAALGYTPLMITCIKGFAEIVKLLHDKMGNKLEIDLCDKKGNTALMHTMINLQQCTTSVLFECYEWIVKFSVASGASLNLYNYENKTVVDMAKKIPPLYIFLQQARVSSIYFFVTF